MGTSPVANGSWPPGLAGQPVGSWRGCQPKSPVLSPTGLLRLASVHGYWASAITIGLWNWLG